MRPVLFYPVISTEACASAVRILHKQGIRTIDHPAPEITHLLLDVPSFADGGQLRGCGRIEGILERIPGDVAVVGGNLNHPGLDGYKKHDLLQDETYLARNAAITADCALQVAAPLLKTTFRDTPTLILGWGRIGKCLAAMLKALGTPVTVAARRESDRAMLTALGYSAVDFNSLPGCSLLFNTVPGQNYQIHSSCVKIDLASQKSISGEDVIWARGLPGVYAPVSSGALIAETILRLCRKEEIP